MSMFWFRRLWQSALTLFTMLTLMFFLFRMLPGDPTATVISPALYPKAQEILRMQFGLDKPLWEQYFVYVKNLSVFDFGLSFHTGRPVADEIGSRLLNTVLLVFPSLITAYALGSIVGAVVGWSRGSKTETILVFLSTALQSAPVFWLSMLSILYFSIQLDLFPIGHIVSPGKFPDETWRMYFSADFLHHLALPFLVNTLYQFCFPFLLMRSSILATVGEDYVELARMKGLSERSVLYRHAMRNSLLPLATTLPMTLGWAVAGSVVIETVFSWPGLGLLMVEAVGRSDYPVVQAAFLLIAVLTVLGTLIADFLYTLLDPRIVNE
ncbi:ABC transporter permease [Parasedimentitalea huanghaiensis]|uniref:ABC transporter permease subunit n=1 Tax=Parasedimentitalea huanghaiensis TaxID=2682100 RepID=A0A6L6WFU8_9RHOB|nr:ABC transporter permease [Zongyanglinia huanghaiensis]MVO16584.1 ABC transporter permease subunit [Zongyanglinia huanghaiensis]